VNLCESCGVSVGMFLFIQLEPTINSDGTGSGRYGDSLGNTIDYVFMVVDRGQHIYLQSNYPGGNVAGIATRSQ
jgi:hypothetical protein